MILGKHSTPAQIHRSPPRLCVRHDHRRQEEVQTHREGDERTGQDHQRSQDIGSQPQYRRI